MNIQSIFEYLNPYYSLQEIKKALKNYVPTHCQNVAPSLDRNFQNQCAFATRQKLIPFFINRNLSNSVYRDKYYIILAEAGMGKTTLMINLYARYMKKLKDTNYQVKLFPMGYPDVLREVLYTPNRERANTILLLDAFDEDQEAMKTHQKRLHFILQKVSDFKEVVFTCRTQFFPKQEEDSDEMGVLKFKHKDNEYRFRKLYISPFNNGDIKLYLKKNYSIFNLAKRRKAEKIVLHSPSLMVRPMLLHYIDDLIKSQDYYSSTYQVYAELITKWIDREVQNSPRDQEKYRENLYKFSKEVAVNMYNERERRGGLLISDDELKVLAKKHQIDLSTLELKTRTLLHMNATQCTFAHQSILEYFLVTEAFDNPRFAQEMDVLELEQGASLRREMLFEKSKALLGHYKTHNSDKRRKFAHIKLGEIEKVKQAVLTKVNFQGIQALSIFKNLELLQIGGIQIEVDQLDHFLDKKRPALHPKALSPDYDGQFLSNEQLVDITLAEKQKC